MKILLYTQVSRLGGSTRLLLNLAKYLSLKHEVIVSFPNEIHATGVQLFEYFSDLEQIPSNYLIDHNYNFDVGLFHLPFSLDTSLQINCARKIAVTMEIVDKHKVIVNSENIDQFEKMIYLHDEQIEHFTEPISRKKLIKLNLINNINYLPSYHKTYNVGSIAKLNLKIQFNVILSSQKLRKLMIYSSYRPSARELGIPYYILREIFYKLGKLEFKGTEINVKNLYQSFDCLLHTPTQGNGTSVVVSDALASGKYVVLSPLPKYKEAYSHLEGVFFLDEIGYNLTDLIKSYDHTMFTRISDNYRSIYDRNEILKEWETVITNI